MLSFDDNTQNSYDIVHLSNDKGTGRKYIRKFRSNYNEMVWHETVQGAVYRLATGATDSTEVIRIDSNSAIPGNYKGYVITGKMELHGSGNAMTLHRQTGQAAYMAWWDRRDGKTNVVVISVMRMVLVMVLCGVMMLVLTHLIWKVVDK